jgi:hypothetical protein
MLSVKKKLIEFLEKQPDEVSSDEIIEFLLVNEKIDAGIRAIESGEYKTLDEAREYFKKWLE